MSIVAINLVRYTPPLAAAPRLYASSANRSDSRCRYSQLSWVVHPSSLSNPSASTTALKTILLSALARRRSCKAQAQPTTSPKVIASWEVKVMLLSPRALRSRGMSAWTRGMSVWPHVAHRDRLVHTVASICFVVSRQTNSFLHDSLPPGSMDLR